MKKIVFLSFFLLALSTVVTAQDYYMTKPEGFGAAATGGGAPTTSNTVTVTDWPGLYAAINSTNSSTNKTNPKVILVSGTITMPATHVTVLVVNKSIIGLPGARLINDIQVAVGSGILYLKPGSDNVIIRNLIFEGPGAYDVDGEDNLTSEGTNVWVDHCEFQDGMDGNFDNKGAADNVTISWCKFTYLKPPKAGGSGGTNDHRFSDLVSSAKDDINADGHYSITFKNCYWADGCAQRMPRARNAELHILNCYYYTTVSGSIAIGLGGGNNNTTCYVENSNFAKISTVYKSYIFKSDGITPDDGGTVGLQFNGCLGRADSTTGTISKPSYTYSVLPAANVATYVADASCGAGATLQVSTTGVISTNCPNLGVEDHVADAGVKLYPTPVDSVLNIALSDAMSGDVVVDIYSVSGAKVFSFSKKDVAANEVLSLNLSGLSKGLYFCNLKIGNAISTTKFIKK